MLGDLAQDRSVLDLVQTRAESDAVTRLSRVVLEVDGIPQDDRDYQELLGTLNLTVPEVAVTQLCEDGSRWHMRPLKMYGEVCMKGVD